VLVLVGAVLAALVCVASAAAAPAPWWLVQSTVSPTYLPPHSTGTILVIAENSGDEAVESTGSPVTVVDRLPADLEVTGVSGGAGDGIAGEAGLRGSALCKTVGMSEVSCTWSGPEAGWPYPPQLAPYESLSVEISVSVPASAVSGVSEISVSGGHAPPVSVRRPVTVSGSAVPFGVESYALDSEEEGGSADAQAGSHPFQFTSALALNETVNHSLVPPALARDFAFDLPQGLIGNATVTPQCTIAQFMTIRHKAANTSLCPANTAIGVASVTIGLVESDGLPLVETVPLFNVVPAPGEPARFGFEADNAAVLLDTAVRTGGDYGVTTSSSNTTQDISLLSTRVTFWGNPADPRHDSARGWSCIDGGFWKEQAGEAQPPCTPLGASQPRPLLTLPTSCTGPLQSSVAVTSWPTREDPEGLIR
jgi:hypothetical protein